MKLTLIFAVFAFCFCLECLCEKHVKQCNETMKGQICHINETYMKSEYPEPSPCKVDLFVHLKGIYDIDEEMNTISLFLRLTTLWTDKRINLYRTEEDKKM